MIAVFSLAIAGSPYLVSNPWIDHRIREIGQQIDQQINNGRQEDRTLHERKVLRHDRVHDQATDSWTRKDDLNDDGAAEEVAEVEPEQGHQRQQRIAQPMRQPDRTLMETLG